MRLMRAKKYGFVTICLKISFAYKRQRLNLLMVSLIGWFPISWHDNIKYSLSQEDGYAHGGVFTAINPNSNLKIKSHTEIVKGRAQMLHLQWGSFLSFYLINVYLPSGNSKSIIKERDTCLTTITNYIKSLPKKNKSHFIIGGDWNTIHNALDASYARNVVNLEALEELNISGDLSS